LPRYTRRTLALAQYALIVAAALENFKTARNLLLQTAIAPQAYLCGQRNLRRAKDETLILAAKQIRALA